jgi:hypothetical protein
VAVPVRTFAHPQTRAGGRGDGRRAGGAGNWSAASGGEKREAHAGLRAAAGRLVASAEGHDAGPCGVSPAVRADSDAGTEPATDMADKVRIDVPLGWPQTFVTAVTAHNNYHVWPSVTGLALRR